MEPPRWEQIEAAFSELIALDGVARRERLAALGATDPALRDAVEKLLAADDAAEARLAPLAASLVAPTDPLDRLAATLAGRYRVERELGHGGMATVYLAHDLKHDRPVALKVLKPELAAALGRERFLREVAFTARLDHPHIVPLLDSGEAGSLVYYVMPHVDGESLRDRLDREKQLSVDDALQITREVADALDYAHGHGIVHRDIKPANILLGGGHARVADFGIARAVTAAGREQLTETGIAVGTPAYMSPEQGSGSTDLDGRSDLYSLGCVLYEMLAGHPPFTGATPQEALARHSLDAVPRLSAARSAVPATIQAAVERVLAKVPADRYRTAREFAQALQAPAAAESTPTASGRRPTRPRRSLMVVGGTIAAAVAAVVFILQSPGPREPHIARAPRVALLPCANATSDTSKDWLTDRWTDELITKLGVFSTLIVRPYRSVRPFKGRSGAAVDIAATLEVDNLIDCSIALRGDSVDLRVSVIAVAPEVVRWSQTYHRVLLADEYNILQAAVAQQIARALGAEVTGTSRERLAVLGTSDTVALRLYRQAAATVRQAGSSVNLGRKALLEQAIAHDPKFVLAYLELVPDYIEDSPPRALYGVRDSLLSRVLALDSLNPEALAQRAIDVLGWTHDWPRAHALFEQSIALAPNSGIVRQLYAYSLGSVGLVREAITQQQLAASLDPTDPWFTCQLGHAYVRGGRLQEAANSMRRRLAAVPEDQCAPFVLGYTLVLLGEYDQGIPLLEGRADAWGIAFAIGILGNAHARAGRVAEAERVLANLRRRARNSFVTPGAFAVVEAALGQRDVALDHLEQAVRDGGDPSVYFLGPNPWLDPLRDEPRFRALRRQVGVFVDER